MRATVVTLFVAVGLTLAGTAGAADFVNGPAVARAMERHYNGAGYKARLAKAGGRVNGRVLCAHDEFVGVECTGRLTIRRVAVKAEWGLVKRSQTRAKLTWTFRGQGVFEYDGEIISPRALGLRVF